MALGNACPEDRLIGQPAIGLFAEFGWATVSALEETFGATGTLLPRLLSGQVELDVVRGIQQTGGAVQPA